MKNLLNWLKMQYETTSISTTYTNVIIIDKLQVPEHCDPTFTIDKLLALFMQLEDNKLVYTKAV